MCQICHYPPTDTGLYSSPILSYVGIILAVVSVPVRCGGESRRAVAVAAPVEHNANDPHTLFYQ